MPHAVPMIIAARGFARPALQDALAHGSRGFTVTTDAASAIAAPGGSDLVVVDFDDPVASTPTCAEIRRAAGDRAVPIVAFAASEDLDERIGLLEAGADAVLSPGAEATEIAARIEGLLWRARTSVHDSIADAPPTRARVIAVYSPKGGTGVTTIAANLAAAATELVGPRTLLLDLDLPFGQAALHLGAPARGLTDTNVLADPARVQSLFDGRPDGPAVLGAAVSPELAGLVTAKGLETLLADARRSFPVVVVDLGSEFNARARVVLPRADVVLIPVTPDLGSIVSVRHLLDQLAYEDPRIRERTLLVFNHLFARDPVAPADLVRPLGMPMAAELPYDPTHGEALGRGIPLVRLAPNSPSALRFRQLADRVLAEVSPIDEVHALPPRRRGPRAFAAAIDRRWRSRTRPARRRWFLAGAIAAEAVIVLAIALVVLIPGSPLSASSTPGATAMPSPPATVSATPTPTATPSALPSGGPAPTPMATSSATLVVTPSPRPSAPASAAPSPQPTPIIADYRLPNAVQPAGLRFSGGNRRCDGAPAAFDATATFTDLGSGGLRILFQGRSVTGMLHSSGAFDAAGTDPLEHWWGRLTAAGGRATYEVYSPRGCVQSYDVIIAFQ